jgi:high-affinity K+ transport system ATPase subunit B
MDVEYAGEWLASELRGLRESQGGRGRARKRLGLTIVLVLLSSIFLVTKATWDPTRLYAANFAHVVNVPGATVTILVLLAMVACVIPERKRRKDRC